MHPETDNRYLGAAGKFARRKFSAKTAALAAGAAAAALALGGAAAATAQPLPHYATPALDSTRSAQFAAARTIPEDRTISLAAHPIVGAVSLDRPLDLSGPKFDLPGQIAPIVASSTATGRIDSTKTMTVTFYLKPNDKAGMDKLAAEIYDPSSPLYHHFLTPAQRIARFSPTVAQFDTVAAYIQSGGLSIVDSTPDRQSIRATGTANQLEAMLGIDLDTYRKPDGAAFFAPSRDPSLPAQVAPLVEYIRGLTNSATVHTANVVLPIGHGAAPAASTSAAKYQNAADGSVSTAFPNGIPSWEIQYAYGTDLYDGTGPIDGKNQSVSLVEFANWDNDVYVYVTNNNNTWPNNQINYLGITTVMVNGYTGYITGNENECNEDIEMLEAQSPGLSGLTVYEEGTGDMDAVLEQVLASGSDNVLSSSYVEYEVDMATGSETTYDQLTEELALQGVAMFVASGDNGSYPNGASLAVNGWAASPWVTAVGGTSLSIDDTNGAYVGESVWNDIYGASGGGISLSAPIPTYQSNYLSLFPNQNTEVSTSRRNIPDVSLNADPGAPYNVYIQGGPALGGGTSLATPLWAGYWANVDQYREDYSEGPLGFANPALYSLAEGPDYNADFHDITTGSNTDVAFSTLYDASIGFDDATGLGSINGLQLTTDLYYQSQGSAIASITGPSTAQSGQSATFVVTMQAPFAFNGPTIPNQVDLYARADGSSNWVQVGTGRFIVGNYGYNISAYVAATIPDTTEPNSYEFAASVSLNNAPQGPISSTNAIVSVTPNAISTLTLATEDVSPGQTDEATLTLAQPAVQNEQIDLSSSLAGASVPADITVQAGQQTASFAVAAGKVSTTTGFTITAKADPSSGLLSADSADVNGRIVPNVPQSVHALGVSPKSVMEGKDATGIVTLTLPAGASGQTVTLQSANPAAATVPASIVVPAGDVQAKFPIVAVQGTLTTTVAISATITGTATRSATLAIVDPVVAVSKVALGMASVIGGKSFTATLRLNTLALDGGYTVALRSSDPMAATVPATVVVPAGKLSAQFTVTTYAVASAASVTIAATGADSSASAALMVRH